MALAGSLAFVWLDARQQREYRRLLAAGDDAVARGQTLEAIEAFSGALTLKPDSMIARLMRGETYRQRGEFSSAVRDLTEAAALDPTAPRPLELLGDAHAAMGQHAALLPTTTSAACVLTTARRVWSTSWALPAIATATSPKRSTPSGEPSASTSGCRRRTTFSVCAFATVVLA